MGAVMAKYNPFAEKAGLNKVTEQKPLKNILSIAAFLSEIGFNLQLLSSEHYVLQKINCLSSSDRAKLKALFIKNKHPRFKKESAVSRHHPFGKTSDFINCIENADSVKMAKLVKIVGLLLQTKVYLFWSRVQAADPECI
jgi:hypothetical protein